jgi:DNA mismatch repair protein MutL
MSDIINLLPDAVANQIAAGEVIQRPASVIKELVENAVDAGASRIGVYLKDAGRTSIQVTDNGSGMSVTDARMAFERHATSKISDARDLFAIRTLGFRGEALASIAAVAEVKLRTKRADDELGTEIDIAATQILEQTPISCPDGSTFLVRNLFFNTPARRKFLKSNSTELKHIINEFHRVALTHPEIELVLQHNNLEIYNLPQSIFRQRICNIFGKSINQYLIPVNADTSIVKISGFIGKPDIAKKSPGEQFFFVNQRFIRHPFLHRAVMKAYEQLMPADEIPTYFIYFEVDPESIDINIHPTKTEVKFEDEQSIFQILLSSLKEALGKFNIVPSLDFDIDRSVNIPVLRTGDEIRQPVTQFNPNYNPFETSSSDYHPKSDFGRESLANWEKMYEGIMPRQEPEQQTIPMDQDAFAGSGNENPQQQNALQIKGKYILTPVKSGLMLIDQKRAHERILFERYLQMMQNEQSVVQRSLFPVTIELGMAETGCLMEVADEIKALGFEFDLVGNTLSIKGYPSDAASDPAGTMKNILAGIMNEDPGEFNNQFEKIAAEMARASAIPYGKNLSPVEMREMIDMLFACATPNYSPSGKQTINILTIDELDKRLA